MSITDFIRRNRSAIDRHITSEIGRNIRLNNEERESWVLNDEGLYTWARSCGVDI